MYLTYAEYTQMGGTLNETVFEDIEFEAETKIDWYTFNRLQNEPNLPEAVKRCMYKLIQMITTQMQVMQAGGDEGESSGISAGIASQSNDGVSTSYNILSAKDIVDTMEKDIEKAIKAYLQGVMNSLGQKVLYRGLYPGE